MTGIFQRWLPIKWRRIFFSDDAQRIAFQKQRCEHYRVAFATTSGSFVLHDLLDAYYCTALDSTATLEQLAFANGQQFVIQKILETIDEAEHPGKYEGVE